jgi:hypothetical protein
MIPEAAKIRKDFFEEVKSGLQPGNQTTDRTDEYGRSIRAHRCYPWFLSRRQRAVGDCVAEVIDRACSRRL